MIWGFVLVIEYEKGCSEGFCNYLLFLANDTYFGQRFDVYIIGAEGVGRGNTVKKCKSSKIRFPRFFCRGIFTGPKKFSCYKRKF